MGNSLYVDGGRHTVVVNLVIEGVSEDGDCSK